MPTSDLAAAEVLALVTKPASVTPMAWWLVLVLDDPGQDLSNAFGLAETAAVQLNRTDAAWVESTDRLFHYASDLTWSAPAATFVPWGWVIKSAETGGSPLFSRRVVGVTAYAGSPIRLPGSEIAFRYPLVPA